MPTRISLSDYFGFSGREVGFSSWILIDQARIDAFAAATLDKQFIHVDPVRARETEFGGTIAHGFLTLSLLSAMAYEAVPEINGAEIGLNYGFNALRFVSAVKAGSSVRGRFTLLDVIERRPGQWQSTFKVVVDILDADKPALTAEWLNLVIIP
jgi:acyl dehydratase